MVLPILQLVYNKASGAFSTNHIAALCCESGQLPFEYIALLIESVTAVRMIELGRTSQDLVLIQRAKTSFESITGRDFPEIIPLFRWGPQTWDYKSPKVDWSMSQKIRAGDCPAKAQACFHEISYKYETHYKMFTDGSKGDGKTGYGVHSIDYSEKGRLHDECSVFSAEVMAIKAAIQKSPEDCKTVIFTDSASSIRALEKGFSNHPFI